LKKAILIFGSLAVAVLLLFQLEKWSLFGISPTSNLSWVIYGSLFLILGALIGRFVFMKNRSRKTPKIKSTLSDQELKVLALIDEGLSNKQIAGQLHIAETTVKTHVSNILTKLNANRRTEAVRIARDGGILS